MRKATIVLLLMQIPIVFFFACTKDQADSPAPVVQGLCDTLPATFAADVQPIFTSTCAVQFCHDNSTAASGYDFSAYAGISAAETNPTIMCAINHSAGCSPMPQGGPKMADSLIQKIECWIENGAQNN